MKKKVHFKIILVLQLFFCSIAISQDISFKSDWECQNDRVWIGQDYWANPLKDWRIHNGRLECVNNQGDRNLQLITYQIKQGGTIFHSSVTFGNIDLQKSKAGFKIGLKGIKNEYRFNSFYGKGLKLGFDQVKENLFCLNEETGEKISKKVLIGKPMTSFILELSVMPNSNGYTTLLILKSKKDKQILGTLELKELRNEDFSGNLALFADSNYWFESWSLGGDKIQHVPKNAWGPVLWSQYTLSKKNLKLLVIMAPIGKEDAQYVSFQINEGGIWKTMKTEKIESLSKTALFNFKEWKDDKDFDFRLEYQLSEEKFYWNGVIRKDPIDKTEVSVAGFTGHKSYNFPNLELVANVEKHDPDMLFFSGDQIYEDNGGYGVVRKGIQEATLSYLSKYYMFGWSFGNLMKDRPTVILPDDHDVFYGNIWGDSGAGYFMPTTWVNMVQISNSNSLIVLYPKEECLLLLLYQVSIQVKTDNSAYCFWS